MRLLNKRVRELENAAGAALKSEIWHTLHWDVGQPWADVLATYGEDRIKPEHNVMLISFIDAKNGAPVPDPIKERDQPIADAWLAQHGPLMNGSA